MTTEFRLPELGENIQAGDVITILVSEGDAINIDDPVLELETDKATVEVPSSVSGVIKAIHVKEGDTVQVGQVILTAAGGGAGEAATPPQAEETPGPVTEVEAEEVSPPEVGTGVVPAPEPPTTEPVQAPAPPPAVVDTPAPPATPLDWTPRPEHGLVPAAPNVRRLARQIGVDITQVTGTGPGGRVSMDDVKRYARELWAVGPVAVGRPAAAPLPDFSRWGRVEREPMSNIRRATARQMGVAWSTIPHVTQFDKADVTDLEQLRQRFGPKVEEAGGKLTITAILLKIAVAALKEFPQFNASLDMANEEIIYKQYYHIGVAVDTDRGLLVPVIRDVDQKNIIELAVELGQIAEKARNRKLGLEDMQGSTFTITNLGGIGGTNFIPIVNSPEVAILGVARGRKEPVFSTGGQVEPRLRLPLALSYDHRLIDGADGARFLRWIVEYLEQPFLTALQGW